MSDLGLVLRSLVTKSIFLLFITYLGAQAWVLHSLERSGLVCTSQASSDTTELSFVKTQRTSRV